MKRFGAPFGGGWMNWPLRWLLPVELALNVYETLTAVGWAMSNLEGDSLTRWQAENTRLTKAALEIQNMRDGIETENDD